MSKATMIWLLVWAVCIATGMVGLVVKSSVAGAIASPPRAEPEYLPTGAAEYSIVVAIHPRCPCSLATLDNLERLASRHIGKLACHILMFQPADADEGWTTGLVWDMARRVPGATIQPDVDAQRSARLGALTSGSAVLYDAQGRALFAGGLTVARAHAGDSPITDWIDRTINDKLHAEYQTAVFGCPITGCPDPEPNGGGDAP